MLFCQFSLREVINIKEILHDFMTTFGTLINNEKSSILFFNTPVNTQDFLAMVLDFGIISLPSKYLGMPMVFNSLKTSCWKDLLQKIQKKLNSWDL